MTKMSLIDKLGVLLEVTKSSKMLIIAIIFLLFLAYIFKTTNQKNKNSSKKIYLVIYGVILAFLIITYRTSLGKMFDYMMDNFFIVLYFPNVAIYFIAIVATNIIIWISIFNSKISKLIKNINITIYCIITYLLIVVLNVITTNKLDIFNQTSVYGNKQAQALIELSSVVFILWVIFLSVYKIIRVYQHRQEEQEEMEWIEEVTDIQIHEKNLLPQNVIKIDAPHYVMAQELVKVTQTVESKREVTSKEKTVNPYDQLLTLDDYKLLLNMLKEQKQKERVQFQKKIKEENHQLKELEPDEKIPKKNWQVENIQPEEEQTKFQELQELYRSVR